MKEIATKATSLHTAEATPIVVRAKESTRWVFLPLLIDNARSPDAAVKGALVYQKKGRGDAWENIDADSLASMKKGDSVVVHLSSEETLRLFAGLRDLYALHLEHGVPAGEKVFVSAEESLRRLADLTDEEIERLREFSGQGLTRLLRWAAGRRDLADSLAALPATQVYALADLSGLQALKRALEVWDENQLNPDEEFWEKQLVATPVLLQQLFAYPVVIVDDKAYVGGKRFDNSGGRVADFLVRNSLTANATLVEIKTPCTRLLGAEYRGVFPPSPDLAGAMTQVLNYRRTLTQDIAGLSYESGLVLEACEPPCLVLAGHAGDQLGDRPRRRSFELFRRQLHRLEVVTFDELFERGRSLVALLEGGGARS